MRDLESCKVLEMLDCCVRGGLDPLSRYLIGAESRTSLRRETDASRKPG